MELKAMGSEKRHIPAPRQSFVIRHSALALPSRRAPRAGSKHAPMMMSCFVGNGSLLVSRGMLACLPKGGDWELGKKFKSGP
jgi:hypothetical protein